MADPHFVERLLAVGYQIELGPIRFHGCQGWQMGVFANGQLLGGFRKRDGRASYHEALVVCFTTAAKTPGVEVRV